jgi:DNA-binding MarR family transcriptional regulator
MPDRETDQPITQLLWAVLLAADEATRVMSTRLGLGARDTSALNRLLTHGPEGPADLGRALGLGSAAATALADRLERAGHVERHPQAGDRRRLQLVPTAHAGREVGRALNPLLERLDLVEDVLTTDARAAVRVYLEAVVEAYRSYSGPEEHVMP